MVSVYSAHPGLDEIDVCFIHANAALGDFDLAEDDGIKLFEKLDFSNLSHIPEGCKIVHKLFEDAIIPLFHAVQNDERGEVKNSFTKIIRTEVTKLRELSDRQPEMRDQYRIAINEIHAATCIALSKDPMTRERALAEVAKTQGR